MAFLGRTKLEVREFGGNVDVPNNPRARLMYYLNCMSTVLDLDDSPNLSTLTNYSKYNISEDETLALVALCVLLSPQLLLNKCIFQDDEMCGNSGNKFFEISAVQQHLLLTNSVAIGGINRGVKTIMAFKKSWLQRYWSEPIQELAKEPEMFPIERDSSSERRPLYSTTNNHSSDCCCNCSIL